MVFYFRAPKQSMAWAPANLCKGLEEIKYHGTPEVKGDISPSPTPDANGHAHEGVSL